LTASVNKLTSEIEEVDKRRLVEIAAKEALQSELTEVTEKLSIEERKRLTEIALVASLRKKLQNSTAELTAMSLALEEKRKEAENTLSLLAAARTVEDDLTKTLSEVLLNSEVYREELEKISLALEQSENNLGKLKQNSSLLKETLEERLAIALAEQLRLKETNALKLSESQAKAILLNSARDLLSKEQQRSSDAERKSEVLIQQVASLQKQLSSLQDLLDIAAKEDSSNKVQLQTFGANLNIALARLAAEQKAKAKVEKDKASLEIDRASLQAEKAKLLMEKNNKLENFKSEFFGEIRKLLETQEGVRVSGDRFVFSSEILFASGEANLSLEGKGQISKIADLILSISDKIPSNIDWILRVDGHTDDKPIRGGKYESNWELSQARALSVVIYMQKFLNIPAYRLAATGFGEYQPIDRADSDTARKLNRRIEIKLTER
jgi:chemotaxis protein MotB